MIVASIERTVDATPAPLHRIRVRPVYGLAQLLADHADYSGAADVTHIRQQRVHLLHGLFKPSAGEFDALGGSLLQRSFGLSLGGAPDLLGLDLWWGRSRSHRLRGRRARPGRRGRTYANPAAWHVSDPSRGHVCGLPRIGFRLTS